MAQRTAVSRWKSLKLFTQVHFNIIIVAKHLLTWYIPAHLVPFDTFCLDNRSTMINISTTCDLLIRMFMYIYMHCFFTLVCTLTLITYSYATYCIHSEFLFLDAKSDQQQSWFQGPNGGRMFGRRAFQKSYQSQSYSSETCSLASLIKTMLWWVTLWSDVPLTDRMTQVSWITTVSSKVLPWTYTLEPKHNGFQKESAFPVVYFSGSMLHFRVFSILVTSDFANPILVSLPWWKSWSMGGPFFFPSRPSTIFQWQLRV